MPRRSEFEIIADILEACSEKGTIRANIASQLTMNYQAINGYLSLLISKRLIKRVPEDEAAFIATPKGKRVLKTLRNIERMLKK